jgi:environmental stress-induced protein Ves
MRTLRWNEMEATPWKNGGGTTRNVACAPQEATLGAFDWRVSIADVAAEGPFSAFDGVDRVIMLIEGDAMELEVDGVRHTLARLDALRFAGEAETSARLPAGPTRDVNLMMRRGRTSGGMRAVKISGAHEVRAEEGQTVLLLALTEGLIVNAEHELGMRDVMIAEEAGVLQVEGDGTLIEIRIQAQQPAGATTMLLLAESCARVLPLLRSPELAEQWTQPSELDQWSNAGLAGHLARSAFNLERALESAAAAPRPSLDAATYYADSAPEPPDSQIGRRIRALGDAEAAEGPQPLAARFAEGAARLREQAHSLSPETTVEMFHRALSLEDCAAACLLELVVHTDDLAASLDLEPPAFDPAAVDLVVGTLTRISRARHGDTAVLRALSRAERAPEGGISAF